jgi:hypothetical protein
VSVRSPRISARRTCSFKKWAQFSKGAPFSCYPSPGPPVFPVRLQPHLGEFDPALCSPILPRYTFGAPLPTAGSSPAKASAEPAPPILAAASVIPQPCLHHLVTPTRRSFLREDAREDALRLSSVLTARPFESATVRSYRVDFAAIRTCYAATLNGKSRCCCQLLGRRDATRWHGVELSERSRIGCCFRDRRVHHQLGHRQATIVR